MAGLRLGIDPTGMETGGRRAESAMDRVKRGATETESAVDKSSNRMGTSVSKFGAIAGRALGAAAAAFLSFQAATASIDLARGFNASLAETSTLIEGTDAEMAALSGSARQLAKDFGGGATAQVEAFYQAISAGAGSVEQAATLLDSANRLAIGGATDTTTAVDALTTATNAYAASGLTAASASDAMFVGIKAGKTTAAELSAGLGNIVPIASAVGVSFDEVISATAALTTQGQSTSVAITGLRQVLSGVIKPTSEAVKMAERLGLEFDVQAIKSKGLAGFLEDVIDKTGGNQEAMAQLFGSVEALNAVLAFAGGAGAKFAQINEDMAQKAGATDEAYEKMAASLDQRWTRATAAAMDVALRLGNVLLTVAVPALEILAQIITDGYDAVSALVTGIGSLISEIARFTGLSKLVSATTQFQVATDNATLAMGDEIAQANNLFTLMGSGTTMTQSAALAKLSEAEAHLRNAQTIRDETQAIVDQRMAVLELQRQTLQEGLNAIAAPGTDVEQMSALTRASYEETEASLASIVSQQQNLIALVDPLAAKFDAAQSEVERIREAIKKAVDGVVTFDGEVVTATELSERLALAAGGVDFEGATASARRLSEQLGISLEMAVALSKLGPQGQADTSTLDENGLQYGGRGGNPNDMGGRAIDIQTADAQVFLDNWKPPSVSSGGGGGGASDVDRAADAYDSLMASLDPVIRATQEFEQAQETINAALETGHATAAEAAVAYDLARERFEEASKSANGAFDAWETFAEVGGSAIDKLIAGTISWNDALKETIVQLVVAYTKANLLKSVQGGKSSDSFGTLVVKGLFGGFFDEGGMIGQGQTGIVGEYGPEIVKSTPMGAQVTSRQDTARRLGGTRSDQRLKVEVGVSVDDEGSLKAYVKSVGQQAAQSGAQQAVQQVRDNWAGYNQQYSTDGTL